MPRSNNCEIANYSPLDKISSILLSPPGTEIVFGLSMPSRMSLFEISSNGCCSAIDVRSDHQRMQDEFRKRGINVINMRQIIGSELEKTQRTFRNKEQLLVELKNRIYFLNQTYHLRDYKQSITELETLLNKDIAEFGEGPAIAINATLNNCIKANGLYDPFNVSSPPAANFMYWRDTNHVVGNEICTHTMYFPIRQREVILTEIGLKSLDFKFRKIDLKKGSIEGGDIFPVEISGNRYSFIGRAERTSDEGVESWFDLHSKLWKNSGEGIIPLVIEGPTSGTQDQMHLDTFSQQISANSMIHCGEITSNRRVSLLSQKNGQMTKTALGTYQSWIENNFSNVYNMTRSEQLSYAPNVVVDGEIVYTTRDSTPSVTKFIRNNCIEVVELRMNSLTELYGGAHCATSELRVKS